MTLVRHGWVRADIGGWSPFDRRLDASHRHRCDVESQNGGRLCVDVESTWIVVDSSGDSGQILNQTDELYLTNASSDKHNDTRRWQQLKITHMMITVKVLVKFDQWWADFESGNVRVDTLFSSSKDGVTKAPLVDRMLTAKTRFNLHIVVSW